MARGLDYLPEGDELIQADLAIVVHVDLGEELVGRNPSERAFPVLEGLSFVNRIATIDIKNSKDLFNSRPACGR